MERLTENYLGCNQIKGCSNGTCEEICKEVKDCGVCPISKAIDKLAEYEKAEENGFMKMLPVSIGSDVYFIPSKVNYDLNVLVKHEGLNRVFHQKVAKIVFNERGWYLEGDINLEYGVKQIFVDALYKETWFTTEAEAEQALAKMKGE